MGGGVIVKEMKTILYSVVDILIKDADRWGQIYRMMIILDYAVYWISPIEIQGDGSLGVMGTI